MPVNRTIIPLRIVSSQRSSCIERQHLQRARAPATMFGGGRRPPFGSFFGGDDFFGNDPYARDPFRQVRVPSV